MKLQLSFLRIALFAGLSAACLLAQGDRGTMTGTVTDPADAIVPGAAVVARNTETGAEYTTVSTKNGNYT